MASWKIHLIFDLILVTASLVTLFSMGLIDDILIVIFLVLFNILATLLPDIDTPKSKIRQYVSLVLALVLVGYLVVSLSMDSVLYVIAAFVIGYLVIRFFPTKHRGITHEFWFSIVVCLALDSIFWLMFRFSLFEFGLYYLVILWGYLSHLMLDKVF